jgi:hypothetical protein
LTIRSRASILLGACHTSTGHPHSSCSKARHQRRLKAARTCRARWPARRGDPTQEAVAPRRGSCPPAVIMWCAVCFVARGSSTRSACSRHQTLCPGAGRTCDWLACYSTRGWLDRRLLTHCRSSDASRRLSDV